MWLQMQISAETIWSWSWALALVSVSFRRFINLHICIKNSSVTKRWRLCDQWRQTLCSGSVFIFLHRLCVNPDMQTCSDTVRQMKTHLCKWIFNYIYNKNSSLAVTACFNSSGLNVDDNVLVWLQTRSVSPVSVSLYWGSGRRNCLINLHHEAPSAHPPNRGI